MLFRYIPVFSELLPTLLRNLHRYLYSNYLNIEKISITGKYHEIILTIYEYVKYIVQIDNIKKIPNDHLKSIA